MSTKNRSKAVEEMAENAAMSLDCMQRMNSMFNEQNYAVLAVLNALFATSINLALELEIDKEEFVEKISRMFDMMQALKESSESVLQ